MNPPKQPDDHTSTPHAPAPLARAFSHADNEQPRPLEDALDRGFCSIEVDIWLIDGELRLGHDFKEAQHGPHFEDRYLKPLLARIQANGGAVHPQLPPDEFLLMVDVKSSAGETYEALHPLLEKYAAILTFADTGSAVHPSAVTVIVSGNRPPLAEMEAQKKRYAFYDGRLPDLEIKNAPSLMPVVSDSWMDYFSWVGVGKMPEQQRQKLHDIVSAAHANGQKIRFWDTPDMLRGPREAVWRELVAAGVDYIGTDRPKALSHWLRENDKLCHQFQTHDTSSVFAAAVNENSTHDYLRFGLRKRVIEKVKNGIRRLRP